MDQTSETGVRPSTARQSHFSLLHQDVGIHDLLNIVHRRKWVIIGTVIGSLLLTAIVLYLLTPRYRATALLMIETRQPTIPTIESVLTGITADEQGVRSEVEVIRSRGLMEAVARKLSLDRDPEFNAVLRQQGAPKANASGSDTVAAGAFDALLNRLEVTPIEDSRVIAVSFASEDAVKAAEITNALADEYLLAQLQAKFEATRMANSWLDERVAELREQVAASERSVEEFRKEAELLQAGGITLTAQQMAELNAQLILTRAATAEAEARLQQLSLLLESEDGVSTASEVLDSPLIQSLREQQAQVERRVAELAAEYGPSHPRMIQLHAEAEDLESNITAEVNKIARGLENEVAIARARENSLQNELLRLKNRMADANDKEIQLRALEREAQASRGLLATLLARNKEVSSQDEMQVHQADARIISRAATPFEPYFPQKKIILGIVALLSALLSLIFVFVLEIRQRGFVSGEQIEAAADVPSLGFVPLLGGHRLTKNENPIKYIVENPRSALAQALRSIYWSLTLMSSIRPNIVVVTSSHPGEGKTTVATGLARMQALAGRKTLLIDADSRNPSVHRLLETPVGPGLLDILRGSADKGIIAKDSATGLEFLTAGEASEDPMSMLDSQEMDDFLGEVSSSYDLVVVDTPPVMAASDACALSRKADTTIMVVKWSKTPREVVMHSLRQLRRVDAYVAGALLNMVDVSKHAMYTYGDSGAYHGPLRSYYAEEPAVSKRSPASKIPRGYARES